MPTRTPGSVPTGTYLTDGSIGRSTKLLGFRVALANRATAACDILVVGDSVAEGSGASLRASRWTNQLLAALRRNYSVANVPGGTGYQGAWSTPTWADAVTESGTVTHQTNGMGHRSSVLGAGASLTFNSEQATGFTLHLNRSGTDAVSVSVDGGTATNITAGPTGEYRQTFSGQLRQVHSVVVTQTAGSPEVEGVMWFDRDESVGIRLWDSSKGGSKARDWSANSPGGSSAWLTAAVASAITPSLLIIELGLNDALAYNAATFQTYVQQIVTDARAQWANVPVLLIGTYQPPSRQSGLSDTWASYGAALQTIADADPAIAYLDLMRRIGSIPTDVYGFMFDTTHPSSKGHAYYAQCVLDFLRPGLRDTDAVNSTNIETDMLVIDTPYNNGTAPTVANGDALYNDNKYGGILAKLSSGDMVNALGRTQVFSANGSLKFGWKYNRVTTGASAITITVPASGTNGGLEFTIKKVDAGAGTVVVACSNSQTIEGAATKTLSGQWAYITIRSSGKGTSSGVGWEIVGSGGTIT